MMIPAWYGDVESEPGCLGSVRTIPILRFPNPQSRLLVTKFGIFRRTVWKTGGLGFAFTRLTCAYDQRANCSFAPLGLARLPFCSPTACAARCILAPLRG